MITDDGMNKHKHNTVKSRLVVGNNDSDPPQETSSVLIESGGGDASVSTTSSSYVTRPTLYQSLVFRIPRTVDVFGFVLTLPQLGMVTALSFLILGGNGGLVFVMAMGVYSLYNQLMASSSVSSRRGNNGRNGGVRWGGGRNVRGVKDLPKPPPSG
mmetsp:Transcript_22136/g.28446  ORF Transcript_22136/g.28446 Transcript_22136/m.28446 type:complete len:156 (+) Transcript_22136:168-635(+)|eukprot:CAMPEP_0116054942 /NCGR_PEP_ID=MMETSP0322-20121206/3110_1 /TAXON_ID=163516 /ORGANISM="Leptocylindrus danicus var. apora, Strain B651" /LENGTH=155 /DNA_ID=CAMNT_0003538447 /DNA_START=120 /DNA_END=587 /DNA_ORIENTATION=-